jgi:hypothetical protein
VKHHYEAKAEKKCRQRQLRQRMYTVDRCSRDHHHLSMRCQTACLVRAISEALHSNEAHLCPLAYYDLRPCVPCSSSLLECRRQRLSRHPLPLCHTFIAFCLLKVDTFKNIVILFISLLKMTWLTPLFSDLGTTFRAANHWFNSQWQK